MAARITSAWAFDTTRRKPKLEFYQFRMKCHLCDNHFEIKTDPANLDYVIVSGARRQENRWDPTQNEQIVPETKEVQKKLFDDAMYKLEHGAKDTKAAEDAKPVLGQLYQRNSSIWKDDFEANSRLRAEFRASKKQIKLQDEKDKALLVKSSLDISLLPESDSDRRMAALMRLQSAKSIAEKDRERRNAILTRPALPSTSSSVECPKRVKVIGAKLERKSLGIVKRPAASAGVVLTTASVGKTVDEAAEAKKPKLLLCNYSSGSSDSD
ncbi:coiled-coil domain-containing protein 130 homolog isoform X2 [Toxorhynchites rutilus septentrionalis]|uniref:coiled-coil domain-containing protein 130 homolog isoform X2 n=1 Tax=Toxorhynchites rutilus septentrionalis TaxID=329112 RepID=UPI00247862FC|nr:coiled-coil domain-containing protein 130 homolog isoform X2 [Toxorhynchites rutilus septentrionalis]